MNASAHHHFPRLHLWASLTRLGGLENLVRLMVMNDPEGAAISLLDIGPADHPRIFNLRDTKLTGASPARRLIARQKLAAEVLVFHNYYGMTLLGDLVPHQRAVLYLHTNSRDIFELLPRRVEHLDAIFTSGSDLAEAVRDRLPVGTIPVVPLEYPLAEIFFEPAAALPRSGPLRLGYAGRLETDQKQVGRLAGLCQALKKSGVAFELEIAGTGPAELAGQPATFLGRLDDVQMCAAYHRWDMLVCTSDFETGPLVVLEALATGLPPVMPDIPCQATALLRQHALPLYPRGDMATAAALIQRLQEIPATALRQKARQLVAARRPAIFLDELKAALKKVAQQPRRSRPRPFPGGIAGWLPFSLRSRLPGRDTFLK
jgi:glycosyltransferase involved in cell wall biosynthesis